MGKIGGKESHIPSGVSYLEMHEVRNELCL